MIKKYVHSLKVPFDDFAHNVFQCWPNPGFRSDQAENVDFLKTYKEGSIPILQKVNFDIITKIDFYGKTDHFVNY